MDWDSLTPENQSRLIKAGLYFATGQPTGATDPLGLIDSIMGGQRITPRTGGGSPKDQFGKPHAQRDDETERGTVSLDGIPQEYVDQLISQGVIDGTGKILIDPRTFDENGFDITGLGTDKSSGPATESSILAEQKAIAESLANLTNDLMAFYADQLKFQESLLEESRKARLQSNPAAPEANGRFIEGGSALFGRNEFAAHSERTGLEDLRIKI